MSQQHAADVRDHWWWRPGWRVGRTFYTWHVTFADQPEVGELAAAYRPALEATTGLDPIPLQWLHLTMQGLGFTDEVDQADVDRIVEAARQRCVGLGPLKLTLGPAHVDPEAVMFDVQPADDVRELRRRLREAIGDVWGKHGVPEAAEPYTPHVSLAYTNAAGPADALDAREARTASTDIRSCQLIVLNRDNRMYQWEPYAEVPFA